MAKENKLNSSEELDKLKLAYDELQSQYLNSINESQQQISKYSQLQSLIHNTSEGMIIFNPDSTVLSFNLAAQQILGHAEIDVMYQTANHIFNTPVEYGDRLIDFFRDYHSNDNHDALYANHSNGKQIPLKLSISEVSSTELVFFDDETDDVENSKTNDEQTFDLFAISFIDISADLAQQKKIEEQQETISKALEKAQESNRLKAEFIGNISHELRTPLNGILGLSEVLLNTELSKEQHQYVDSISASGSGLLNMVNNILEFTKLGKQQEKQRETIETVEYLSSIRSEFEDRVQGINLALKIRKQKNVPEILSLEDTGLINLTRCLIDNAIKFTHKGSITIELSYTDIEQQKLHLSIIDTGIGMSDSQQKNVFNAFTQVDSSIQRSFGGLGIGLTIVSNIANSLNAEINVDSKLDEGTNIQVTIPLNVVVIPLINTGLLNTLNQQLGDDFAELISTFTQDTQKHFELLKTSINESNLSETLQLLKYLQSSAANVGAERLKHNYQELMPKLDTQDQQQLIEQFHSLLKDFNETSDNLHKLIA